MPSFDKPKKEYERRGLGDANSGQVPRGQRQKLSSEMQHDAQVEDRQEIVKRDSIIAPARIHVPQCNICSHTSRDFIEMMLVRGQSYKGIADRVNPKVDRRSVSHHYKNHMDLQDMAIRRIIEEEAKLQGKDQEEGVNDIITKRSVLEVALRKGYEDILNGVTTVEPRDLIQITKLLAEMDTDQYHVGMDEMRSQVAIFIRAIKDICDLDVQGAIAQRVKELRTHEGLDTAVENAMNPPPVIEASVAED
jgi:hypothetical protein